MKVKKYGSFKFQEYRYLYFGVLVETNNGKKFITKIDKTTRTWEIENNKRPYLFSNREQAQDLKYCLLLNGYVAYVVEIISNAPQIESK